MDDLKFGVKINYKLVVFHLIVTAVLALPFGFVLVVALEVSPPVLILSSIIFGAVCMGIFIIKKPIYLVNEGGIPK